jgi:hypothetical protein
MRATWVGMAEHSIPLRAVTASLVFAGAMLAAPRANAMLGGTIASIVEDARALGAVAPVVRPAGTARFAVHEIRRDGLLLREYVNGEGLVFAVRWQGTADPDLARLLGEFRADYEAARRRDIAREGHERRRVVVGARVVVLRGGHLPSVFGQAHVPALVPEGVRPDALG